MLSLRLLQEIRVAAADALCAATAERPGTSGEVLQLLVDTYATRPQQAVREVGALSNNIRC
jgi:hypothetical protein